VAKYTVTVLSVSNSSFGWRLHGHDSSGPIDSNVYNPKITYCVGDEIRFIFQQETSHPFIIEHKGTTVFGPYTDDQYEFTATPFGNLKYKCVNHSSIMVGDLLVANCSSPTLPDGTPNVIPPTTTPPPDDPPPPPDDPPPDDPPPPDDHYPEFPYAGPDGVPGPYGTVGEEPEEQIYGSAGPKHELDTGDLLDSSDGWYGFVHANRPTDQNQNPDILSEDIIKESGGADYPFTGRLTASTTKRGYPFPSPTEVWNDEIEDLGDSASFLRFWFYYINGVWAERKHIDTEVGYVQSLLSWNVMNLDQYGNKITEAEYVGVSFFRPQYIKNKNAAFTVVDGAHKWTRSAKVQKGGNGTNVSAMSNSESQIDFELIGGQTYIHNQGSTLGDGAMAIAGNPVLVDIAKSPPVRKIYSIYG